MSKQTFSIFQIFALYFPFCMRPYDARSSVTLEKLGFVVREPQSHLELTYFLPKISAFMLISGNWANGRYIKELTSCSFYIARGMEDDFKIRKFGKSAILSWS